MVIWIIACFVVAALLGMVLITYVLLNKNTSKGVALTHGFFAATGIVLLGIYVSVYSTKPLLSLILFILAALGGFTLIFRDLTGRSLPKWLALGHGLTAITAFILLLVALFV
jgi:uncharacterized membrane protein YadS